MGQNRIKVLHLLVTLPVGGAEDLVAAIVTGLDPERFAVQAACIGPRGFIGEELTKAGFPVRSLGLDIKRTSAWRLVRELRSLLKELQPDILHTHLYHPNFYGRLAALGMGLKGVVAQVHNTYTRVKFHRCLANFLLGWATDALVVVSPRVWQDVRRYDGVPASRLRLLPNGINLQTLAAVNLSREEAKARLGVSGFVLGAVGRLEEQKGHTFLLQALPRLKEEIDDLTVLVAGEGRRRESLERQAQELGVGDTVRFLGTRRDMPLIYRALDVFVLPSLWEGLPLALLQAMGAGVPTVATRVSGALEVIQDGVNGRLVPPGDSGALAAAILELYRQPEVRQRLGGKARQTISEHYSLKAMLSQLEKLYLELWGKAEGVD